VFEGGGGGGDLHERVRQGLMRSVQVESNVKKRAKKYAFSIGLDFRGVVSGCHAQHGECWLFPPLVAVFEQMQSRPDLK